MDTHPDRQRPEHSPTPDAYRSERTALSRVALGTYKSIRACDVEIGNVTFLIGRNGAGKSNFLDGLHFIHDAINTNLESAVTAHGSPGSLRTVGTDTLSVELRFTLASGEAIYRVTLRTPDASYQVIEESFTLTSEGVARQFIPPSAADESTKRTLSLPIAAAANHDVKIVYDYISSMRFYDFSIPAIRKVQTPSQGELLRSDGGNLASVLGRMEQDRLERLHEYMRAILPGITLIQRKELGPGEAIQFNTPRGGFYAHHMSSGTLLALAVLVAILQPPDANNQKASLVALEEPEGSLHPATVGVLFDAIMEASNDRQMMVATQNPDLLDRADLPPDSILAVVSGEAGSELGAVDQTTRKALQSHMFTAGELIRLDQIRPAGS